MILPAKSEAWLCKKKKKIFHPFLIQIICKNNFEEKYFLEQNINKYFLFTNLSEVLCMLGIRVGRETIPNAPDSQRHPGSLLRI